MPDQHAVVTESADTRAAYSGREPFTLGIVGGMGPLATVAFYRTLILRSAATRDQDHIRVLIESDPANPDRTEYLIGKGADPRPAIVGVARRLEAAGATMLVMPCNTANAFADEVAAAVSTPLVPWVDTAVAHALAHAPRCVGLLATTGTLRAGIYSDAFRRVGTRTLEPQAADQREIMSCIYGRRGVKATGNLAPDMYRRLLVVARSLAHAGADLLLLGCTELPVAISPDSPDWPVPAIDPAVAAADLVIEAAGLEVRSSYD